MKISLEISVWLLTTLLATGICLQCERCESATRSCSGPLQTCKEPQSACLTLTVETRVGKTRKVATYKGCTKLEYCPPGPFTVTTTPEERIRGNSECCCQDRCNKGALRLPLLSEPNQRWCPPRNLRGSTCTIGDKVFCHGQEVYCIYLSGYAAAGVVAFTGSLKSCTGHRACKAGIRTMTVGPGIMLRRSAVCCKRESCQKQLAKCTYLLYLPGFEDAPPGLKGALY
ncbi:phospholipase A2 inhibitor and Ly6/PLAUR domain-containing protein-like [Podarcis raffonei]|uniref:phospholipase A2 inhibitor and Ly6/PLAUR domain-containing protein-like n=1 Tax=Podarcis raffonei TaxID=65483 RepID=UPI0023296C28|nr:phospholipase A2 inhibitor and Ly6/PLAUR domain-containing protein-like [Podarcis raffonei]